MENSIVTNTPFRASAGACGSLAGRGYRMLALTVGADQGTSVSMVGPDLKGRRAARELEESVLTLSRTPQNAPMPIVKDAFSGVPSWSPPV